MADDNLQARMGVEQARAHQPERMDGGFLAERPARPHQPGMAVVDPGIAGQRVARMEGEGYAEIGTDRPERPVLRQVVIEQVIAALDLGESVGQRADETEFPDAARQLGGRKLRVLQGQGREPAEAVRSAGDLFRQIVVGPARHIGGPRDLRDRLHRRRVQRQDHRFHAVGVHLAQSPLFQVGQPAGKFPPGLRRQEARRILQRVCNREMLFQPDLAVHVSPDSRWPRRRAAPSLCPCIVPLHRRAGWSAIHAFLCPRGRRSPFDALPHLG